MREITEQLDTITFEKKVDEVGKAYVHMNIGNMPLQGFDFDYTSLLDYQIETYAVLKSAASDYSWGVVFDTTHKYFASRPISERQEFAKMLTLMHYEIAEKLYVDESAFTQNLIPLEDTLARWLAEFDANVNLIPNLRSWTERNIPVQSFAGVGERPQDTDTMTFYRDDVIDLTTLVLVCKMMTPIFGIFIEACKKQMDNSLKEIHCLSLMKYLFANRFGPLIDKLKYFISRIMRPILNKISPTHLFNGYTLAMVGDEVYAGLIVRRYVTVDLFKPNGNIVTYTTSCVRAAAQTQFSATGYRTATVEMTLPKEQVSMSDEGNVSNLEAESRSSSKTADFTVLIQAAAEKAIDSFVAQEDLDQEFLNNCYYYYSLNHIDQTPLNTYILSTYFGRDLNGAKSIASLDAISFSKLCTIFQIHLYKTGFDDLATAMTLIGNRESRVQQTGNDAQFRAMWNNSYEYKICDERFPWSIGDMRWDTRLKEIVENLTTMKYVYNVAPAISNMLNRESRNGELYIPSVDLSRQICSIIMQLA